MVTLTCFYTFCEGIGGAVYINFSPLNPESGWQLMGHLTNQKPSAIFKISGLQMRKLFKLRFVFCFNK